MNSSNYIGNRNFDRPVFVLGPARSGTSMVTGLLSFSGGWLGPTNPPSPQNIKGFFENRGIKDVSTYKLLRHNGFDRRGQDPLPFPNDDLKDCDIYNEIFRVAIQQGYDNKLFIFKDAKITLLWKIFLKEFPKADYIICCRRDEAIIDSCMRTKFMNNLSTWEGWRKWLDIHYLHIEEFERQENVRIYKIDTDRVAKKDFGQFFEICEELRFYIPKEECEEFVEPTAWKCG